MKYAILLAMLMGTLGCGTVPAKNNPTPTRDELLDPAGNWNKQVHGHLTVMPKQFAKWKTLSSEWHTWCANFKAKECDETYTFEGQADDLEQSLRAKTDPACPIHNISLEAAMNNCAGNFIEYYETENAEPYWVKGEQEEKFSIRYTAEGRWNCPNGFHFVASGMSSIDGRPIIYYVPPSPRCEKYFSWGVWRRSPYAKDSK